MRDLKPQLLMSLKEYSKEKFIKDVIAGLIVAGFLISALGGSKVQIAGPTAAFATIVAGVAARNGLDGLAVATILAGILLILMGLLRMGSMIKFIPYTITTGFAAGIAVTILIGQLKDFFGLTFQMAPIETMEKLEQAWLCRGTMNVYALGIGGLALAVLILWPKSFRKVPASLIAVF